VHHFDLSSVVAFDLTWAKVLLQKIADQLGTKSNLKPRHQGSFTPDS